MRVQFICKKHEFSQSKRIDLKVEGDAEKAVAVVKREKALGQSSGDGAIIPDRETSGIQNWVREREQEESGGRRRGLVWILKLLQE